MSMDTKPYAELPELEPVDYSTLWNSGMSGGWFTESKRREQRERQLLAALQSIAALTARAEKDEETIGQIADWCEAYPVEIFGGKPDMKEVRRLLGDNLLSQVSADNFLHVLNGIKRIITRTNS